MLLKNVIKKPCQLLLKLCGFKVVSKSIKRCFYNGEYITIKAYNNMLIDKYINRIKNIITFILFVIGFIICNSPLDFISMPLKY